VFEIIGIVTLKMSYNFIFKSKSTSNLILNFDFQE